MPSPPLNNVTTADLHTAAATIEYPGSVLCLLSIANNAVLYELDQSDKGSGDWGPEYFLPPVIGPLPALGSGIRFRSAVAGKPAQLSAQLLNEEESAVGLGLSAFGQQVSAGGVVTPGQAMLTQYANDVQFASEPGIDLIGSPGLTVVGVDDPANSRGKYTLALAAELGYTEYMAPVAVTATTEPTANTIVTAPAITFDGGPVLVEFYSPKLTAAAGLSVTVCLYDGGNSIGQLAFDQLAAGDARELYALRRFSPSAGSHTYSIRAFVSGNTGTIAAGVGVNGALMPGFIRITRAI